MYRLWSVILNVAMYILCSYRSLFFWALLRTCIGPVVFVFAAFHLCAAPLPPLSMPLPPLTPPLKNLPRPYMGRKDLDVSTYKR